MTTRNQPDKSYPFRAARRVRDTIKEHWLSYLLFVPTLIMLLGLIWYPFFRGIFISLHEWPILGQSNWSGLGNYSYLLNWQPFVTSLKATGIFALTTVFQLIVALIAAVVLKHQSRFRNVLNGLFLLPYTLPPVVAGAIWLYLVNPTVGPVMELLLDFGLINNPIYWGSDGQASMAVIMGVTTWTFWPFMFLIIFASIENIPQEYYETAQVYGASRVQQFIKITLPQLKSAILVAISIRTVWNLAKISQPLQLTGGGPGYETSVLAILTYRFGWRQGRLGLAFAVGIILFIITLGFIILFIREFEDESEVAG